MHRLSKSLEDFDFDFDFDFPEKSPAEFVDEFLQTPGGNINHISGKMPPEIFEETREGIHV